MMKFRYDSNPARVGILMAYLVIAHMAVRFAMPIKTEWIQWLGRGILLFCCFRGFYVLFGFPFAAATTPAKRRYLWLLFILFAVWAVRLKFLSFLYRTNEGFEFIVEILGLLIYLPWLGLAIFTASCFCRFPCGLYLPSSRAWLDRTLYTLIALWFAISVIGCKMSDFSGPVLGFIEAYTFLALRAGIIAQRREWALSSGVSS